jgi:hypothetical protein
VIRNNCLAPFTAFCVEAVQSFNSNMFLLLTVTAGNIVDVQRGTSPPSSQCLATAVGGKGSRKREVDPSPVCQHYEHTKGQGDGFSDQFFVFMFGIISQPVRSLLFDGGQHVHKSLLQARRQSSRGGLLLLGFWHGKVSLKGNHPVAGTVMFENMPPRTTRG